MKILLMLFLFLLSFSALSGQYIVTCKQKDGIADGKIIDSCLKAIYGTKDIGTISPKKYLDSISGFVVELTDKQKEILKNIKEVEAVTEDHKMSSDVTTKQNTIGAQDITYTWGLSKIKVPEALASHPSITGTGRVVGIVDSGILGTHQEFNGTGKILAWKDFTGNDNPSPWDDCGHGTHVAGTIVGGSSSGQQIGVAPGAKVVIAKALWISFPSMPCSGSESDIITAMQWMANYDGLGSKVDVVNMSLGRDRSLGEAPDLATEPLHKAVNYLAKKGILVVVSAGNAGPATKTVGFPGSSPAALTVAAIDSNSLIASFSSRGPSDWTRKGSLYTYPKPEISGPGVSVFSSFTNNGNIGYTSLNGTSMAAPHISGVAALIKQAKPGITVNNIIKTMQRFATPLPNSGNTPNSEYGRGIVDVKKILDACLSSSRTDDCTDLVPRTK